MIFFVPPPQWPTPPPGWLPPAGWSPDASWPPAPSDWAFYVDDHGRALPPPPGAWHPPVADPYGPRAAAPHRRHRHHRRSLD